MLRWLIILEYAMNSISKVKNVTKKIVIVGINYFIFKTVDEIIFHFSLFTYLFRTKKFIIDNQIVKTEHNICEFKVKMFYSISNYITVLLFNIMVFLHICCLMVLQL